jgi:hypothetical protein
MSDAILPESMTRTEEGLPRLGFTTKETAKILGFQNEHSVRRLIHLEKIHPIEGYERPFIISLEEIQRFLRDSTRKVVGTEDKRKKARS